jgi:hypothetical protein
VVNLKEFGRKGSCRNSGAIPIMFLEQGVQNFAKIKNKSSSSVSIVGSRRVAGCRFCSKEPQILGATVNRLIRPGNSAPGICAPPGVGELGGIYSILKITDVPPGLNPGTSQKHSIGVTIRAILPSRIGLQVRYLPSRDGVDGTVKVDSHTPCRSHAVPLQFPCHVLLRV